jgi:hypothetical protein
LTAALYATAAVSRSFAAVTRVQIIVPMIFIDLIATAESARNRPVPVSEA